VHQRYFKAIQKVWGFAAMHWPALPRLPVLVPILLLFLQTLFDTSGLSSPIETTVRAVNYIHRIYGHPELNDPTLSAARSGWRHLAAARVRHTAMITTDQISSLIAYALHQNTFVFFRLAVVIGLMATSGLRKKCVLRLARYDLFFYTDRLVLFVTSAKNRVHRHGSFRTIARMPGAPWCAVHMLEQYLLRTGLFHVTTDVDLACPIFRASRGSPTGTVLVPATWTTKPIADSTMSSLFRTSAAALKFPEITFHSIRVWMASSLAASDGIILTKQHGDWRSDSVHTYVDPGSDTSLKPSTILSAKLSAQLTSPLPISGVSVPTSLPASSEPIPIPVQEVGPDEVLVSW